MECPTCSRPLTPPILKCSTCGAELHRGCAKKVAGKWYCSGCFKRAKREAKFELMAQRATVFAVKKPGKTW